jgi:hypothetical protein
MKRIHIEPLEGEERVGRSILDWVSEVVFMLDFVKSKMGHKGLVQLGRHLGSIEKLSWSRVLSKMSPAEFLARTYKGNYEPIGFKAENYEGNPNSGVMVVKECPYINFWRKHTKGIGSLTQDDFCIFGHATFEWIFEFNFSYQARRTERECHMFLRKRRTEV